MRKWGHGVPRDFPGPQAVQEDKHLLGLVQQGFTQHIIQDTDAAGGNALKISPVAAMLGLLCGTGPTEHWHVTFHDVKLLVLHEVFGIQNGHSDTVRDAAVISDLLPVGFQGCPRWVSLHDSANV